MKDKLPTEAEFRAELAEVFPGIHWDAVKVVSWGLVAVRGLASVSVELSLGGVRVYAVGHSNDPECLSSERTTAGMATTLAEAKHWFERNVKNGVWALIALGVNIYPEKVSA